MRLLPGRSGSSQTAGETHRRRGAYSWPAIIARGVQAQAEEGSASIWNPAPGLSPAHDKDGQAALHHRHRLLVHDVQAQGDHSAAQAGEGLRLGDPDLDVNRVADVDRLSELPLLDLPEGEYRTFQDPRPHGQADGVRSAQHAVGDTLPEGRSGRVFGVGVNRIEVSG